MKYYIIQENGFEYNDEIYSFNQDGAGTPVKVFKNKEDAKNEILKLEFEKFTTEPIFMYAYDRDDIVKDIDGFCKKLSEITNAEITSDTVEDNYDFTLPKMTEKQFQSIRKYISLNFYEIVECDGQE